MSITIDIPQKGTRDPVVGACTLNDANLIYATVSTSLDNWGGILKLISRILSSIDTQ